MSTPLIAGLACLVSLCAAAQAGSTIPGNWEEANSGTGLGGTGLNPGSTSLGSVTGTLKIENTYYEVDPSRTPQGVMMLAFNRTDSINFLENSVGSTVPIVGGTGAYAGATGSLTFTTLGHSGPNGYEFKGTGTVTTAAPGAPIITQVKMAYGSSTLISKNGWLEIHGTNLVPADTPATGVDWSNAPEFVTGDMPTRALASRVKQTKNRDGFVEAPELRSFWAF